MARGASSRLERGRGGRSRGRRARSGRGDRTRARVRRGGTPGPNLRHQSGGFVIEQGRHAVRRRRAQTAPRPALAAATHRRPALVTGLSSSSKKPPSTSNTRSNGSTLSEAQRHKSSSGSRPATNKADAGSAQARRRSWYGTCDRHDDLPSPHSARKSAVAMRSALSGCRPATDQPPRSPSRPVRHPGGDLFAVEIKHADQLSIGPECRQMIIPIDQHAQAPVLDDLDETPAVVTQPPIGGGQASRHGDRAAELLEAFGSVVRG